MMTMNLPVVGSDGTPIRRSPRHVSSKDVIANKGQSKRKQVAKPTPDNTPEHPRKAVQSKSRQMLKSKVITESVDDITEPESREKPKSRAGPKSKLSAGSKSKSSKSTARGQLESDPELDDNVEQNLKPKTRGAKKRASLSDDNSPPTKRVRTRVNTKTPESPALNISATSSNLDESPSTKKSSKVDKPLSTRMVNGKKTSTSSATATDIKNMEELRKANKQLEELTKKYEELKRVGIQDAENTFSEYKNNAEKRFEASDEAIQRLKKELAKLKEQKSVKKQLENQKLLEKQAEELESLNKQLEKIEAKNEKMNGVKTAQDNPSLDLSLQLYQQLSQLTVVQIERTDQDIVFKCEQTGSKGTLRYVLRQDLDDPETFHYEPLLDEEKDADLIEQIPSYFNEAISFKKAYASLFFWRALDSLKKEAKKH
ncbi:hypothetical protein K7432_001660 [Basidiobolus ranarum]|uniref:Monopolin complex subunit Csm1/Pcs1 C-terminal domain-containing protein n=1 Tax=Basidiobolus ranarum TaxID=34480 RepID=A0ABR2X2M8_9FUNG